MNFFEFFSLFLFIFCFTQLFIYAIYGFIVSKFYDVTLKSEKEKEEDFRIIELGDKSNG